MSIGCRICGVGGGDGDGGGSGSRGGGRGRGGESAGFPITTKVVDGL